MIAGRKRRTMIGHKIGDCPLFLQNSWIFMSLNLTDRLKGIGRAVKDRARNLALYATIGAAGLMGVARASDAAPSVYIVPENGIKQLDGSYKATVNQGQPSFFDVYINSDGAHIYSLDMDIAYSNSNLTVDNATISNDKFWGNKTLTGDSTVNGKTANLMMLTSTTYANSIDADDAAFRVNYTAGQDLGTTYIGLECTEENNWPYAELLERITTNPPLYRVKWTNQEGNGSLMNVQGANIEVVTPEPATIALFGLGSLGIFALKRKK